MFIWLLLSLMSVEDLQPADVGVSVQVEVPLTQPQDVARVGARADQALSILTWELESSTC